MAAGGELMSNFKILATVDLTDSDSIKNMWNILYSVKKDIFNPNERIEIIYSTQTSNIVLDAVYEMLAKLDIPDFFILLTKTDSNVDNIHTFNLNKNFCIYPWSNLRFDPDGTIVPCCRISNPIRNSKNVNFNINHDDINAVYLSNDLIALRESFKNGDWPNACFRCKNDEDAGILSLRNQIKIKYFDLLHATEYTNNSIENLRILDINLGNECNLSCSICSPECSSKIAQEKNLPNPLIVASDEYINNILKVAKHLRYLNIQGGEPLMSKKCFKLLEKLIELDYAKNIELDFATNGTLYSKKFLDLCSKFKKVKLTFSIDDLGDRFEYQRYGAKWSLVEENIKKYQSHISNKLVMGIHPAISIQNVYYLPELVEWINRTSLPYSFSLVRHPSYFCIENLNSSIKEQICAKLDKFNHNKEIQAIINVLNNSTHNKIEDEFFIHIKKLDQLRNQQFSSSHSDIAKIIGIN